MPDTPPPLVPSQPSPREFSQVGKISADDTLVKMKRCGAWSMLPSLTPNGKKIQPHVQFSPTPTRTRRAAIPRAPLSPNLTPTCSSPSANTRFWAGAETRAHFSASAVPFPRVALPLLALRCAFASRSGPRTTLSNSCQ